MEPCIYVLRQWVYDLIILQLLSQVDSKIVFYG
jgi:hypothetical protein